MRQPVQAAGAGLVSLDRYMQLPVEQYCAIPLPMQASLVRTARPDEFEMRVPELAFRVPGKPITVAPLVVASVVSERDRVVIASDSCTLTGSSEAMRLIEATRLCRGRCNIIASARRSARVRRPHALHAQAVCGAMGHRMHILNQYRLD